ncbi:MAG: AraC family transcriptional regulator ligand-binding domain-containing protein [Nannocystaceae bacterium]
MGDREHSDHDGSAPSTVSAETGLACVAYAVGRGVPIERITRSTGLTATDLSEPAGRLPAAIMGALWRFLDETFPDEALALDMARLAPMSAMGRVGHIAQYAGDLRAALQVFARYAHTMAPGIEVSLRTQDAEVTLSIRHPLDAVDRGHGVELALGLGARLLFENFERVVPRRVLFGHRAHAPRSVYEAYFRAPVLFERPGSALVFGVESLEIASAKQDTSVFHFLEAHLALSRGKAPDELDPLARVRAALAHNGLRGDFRADTLASSLGQSLRHLQRLTQAQGTTVQALIDEARAARARALLDRSGLGVDEVAVLLGYSSDRAFRRAFKRWTGETPGRTRAPK